MRDTKANAEATKAEWDTPMRAKGFFEGPTRNSYVARPHRSKTSSVYKWQGGQEQSNSVDGVLEVLEKMEQRNDKAKQ